MSGPPPWTSTGLMPMIFQQRDVGHDVILQVIVDHGIAAVLDDDGLAGQTLDIGQGFDQDLGLGDDILAYP